MVSSSHTYQFTTALLVLYHKNYESNNCDITVKLFHLAALHLAFFACSNLSCVIFVFVPAVTGVISVIDKSL